MAALRQHWRRLLAEHATPARLGLAVGVGVVVGCSPFFGLHLFLGLGLALLLRLNKVAVFAGSQISIPPLAPLLGFASVQLGARLLDGQLIRLRLDDFSLTRLPALALEFLVRWMLGGLLVGLALAVPAAFVTALVVRARARRPPDPWAGWRRRVLALYATAPRGHRQYLRFKLRLDPVYRLVCEQLPALGRVVDLGSGLAALPAMLALRGQAREIHALEWDEGKVATARAALGALPQIRVVQADARSEPLPAPADAVVLIDLLHYYPLEEQRVLLRRAAAALAPAGQLVVRETERDHRSMLTRLFEAIAVRTGWNLGPGLCYRTSDELRAELEALGLSCRRSEASARTHRGNFLLWARRP